MALSVGKKNWLLSVGEKLALSVEKKLAFKCREKLALSVGKKLAFKCRKKIGFKYR